MKKLLALFLVLCLLGGCCAALAEAHDLSTLKDSELLDLLREVQQEIVSRRLNKTARLQAGTYIGGRDIPAGMYVLESNAGERDSGLFVLRTPSDSGKNDQYKLYEYSSDTSPLTAFITVEAGDILEVPFPCRLTVSAGVVFE